MFLFFLFYFICVHVERVTALARTHTNTLRSRVSQRHQFLHGVTHILCYASFFFPHPLWTLEGPRRKRRKKKKPCGLCPRSICADRLKGGPGLLSQQRTTHHFPLSSLRLGLITESKHSGLVILLVSQERLLIQSSPQHRNVSWYSDGGTGGEEKKKQPQNKHKATTSIVLKCVSVAPKLMKVLH